MAIDNNTELAYDLRQKYAEIVGYHLEEVAKARIEKNYPDYFKSLENLFTVVKHKFKNKKTSGQEEEDYDFSLIKKEDKDKDKKQTDLQRYYSLRQYAINVANEFENAFLGRTDNPEEISKVERALREIEMFLYYVMDKAKMFGSVGYNEGM